MWKRVLIRSFKNNTSFSSNILISEVQKRPCFPHLFFQTALLVKPKLMPSTTFLQTALVLGLSISVELPLLPLTQPWLANFCSFKLFLHTWDFYSLGKKTLIVYTHSTLIVLSANKYSSTRIPTPLLLHHVLCHSEMSVGTKYAPLHVGRLTVSEDVVISQKDPKAILRKQICFNGRIRRLVLLLSP